MVPLVRTPVSPLAYNLPQGTYSLAATHHQDSICAIGVVTDSLIYEYERTTGVPTTTDHLWFDGGISFRNDNSSVDTLRMTGLAYQSDIEKVCQISRPLSCTWRLSSNDISQRSVG